MSYGWLITYDFLADEEGCEGVRGPGDVPDWMCDALDFGTVPGDRDAEIFKFHMYDDDGIKYVSGRMITDEGKTEESCYGPLGDYGVGGLGCTEIRYVGHPEMNCG